MTTALKIMCFATLLAAPMLLAACETRQVGQTRYYLFDPDTQYVGSDPKASTRVRDTGMLGGYEPDAEIPTFRE